MKEWSTLKKLIWLRKINGGGSDPLNTFTGAIVRFLAKKAKPIVKIEANFTPIQDLNGYDAPWPPGGGKNKLDPTLLKNQASWNAGTIQLKANTTYTASSNCDSSIVLFYIANNSGGFSSSVQVYNNHPVTITTDADGIIKFQQRLPSGGSVSDYWYQIEEGSTATAFAPHSNICPISGHTGCEVVRTGKNLLAKPFAFRPVPSQFSDCFFIKAGTYTFNFDSIGTATSWRFGISMFDKDGNELSANKYIPHNNTAWVASVKMWYWGVDVSVKTITLTFVEDCYTRIWFGSGNTSSDMVATGAQLELGSTATDYEAYSGTTVAISFGQTVYGCQLTVFEDGSGQAVATHVGELFDGSSDENWIKYGSGSAQAYAMKIAPSNSAVIVGNEVTINSSYLKPVTPDSTWGNNDNFISFSTTFSTIVTGIRTITTVEDWKQYLSSNPLQVVYELATPITIPVTAQQIQTIVGENVVLVEGSSGDITVQAFGTEIV